MTSRYKLVKWGSLIIAVAILARFAIGWKIGQAPDDLNSIAEDQLPPATPRLLAIRKAGAALIPLHERMGVPQPGDWREKYTEIGQTFDQYLVGHHQPMSEGRSTLSVQPLGDFTPRQLHLLD